MNTSPQANRPRDWLAVPLQPLVTKEICTVAAISFYTLTLLTSTVNCAYDAKTSKKKWCNFYFKHRRSLFVGIARSRRNARQSVGLYNLLGFPFTLCSDHALLQWLEGIAA